MRLRERVVLVLGAGQMPGETIGNGRAASIAFAREGAHVMAADRDLERARATVAEIGADRQVVAAHRGPRAHPLEIDVTRESECERAVAATLERFGRLDVVHYNVGIATDDAPPMHLTREGWDRMLEVNTTGFVLTTKHVLPVMRAQGSGTILAVSSIAALWTYGSAVAYKASKAAMNAVVQASAVANAKYGIRVNAILPGLMDTPIGIESTVSATGRSRDRVRADRDAAVPLDARGTAWDVAHAAVFLASDEARFITGVNLPVDGGQSARVGG